MNQGSILGPLLFVVSINDITENMEVPYLLYVDGVNNFYAINTISNCFKLQKSLNNIKLKCAVLTLSASKKQHVSISIFFSRIYITGKIIDNIYVGAL